MLSPEDHEFVNHYVEHGSIVAAYKHAFGERPDYDGRDYARRAYKLKGYPRIARAIAEREALVGGAIDAANGSLVERLQREWVMMAFSDIGEMLDDDGNLLPIHEMSEGARSMIASMDVEIYRDLEGNERSRIVKIKRWDKNKVLDSIARCLGVYRDKLEIGIDGDFAKLLQEARTRAGLLLPPEEPPMRDITPAKTYDGADLC